MHRFCTPQPPLSAGAADTITDTRPFVWKLHVSCVKVALEALHAESRLLLLQI